MGPIIGDILPLALGIAISPIPIIAAILMLLSPKARVTSVGFLLGWVLGIVVAVVLFTLLASVIPEDDPDASKPISGVIKIVLGLALLSLALRRWRSRPKPGDEAALPNCMAAFDEMTAGRGLVLGFLLSAVNPKNLLMTVSAGVTIADGALDTGQQVVAVVVFTALAASTVVLPVVAYLVAKERMRRPLEDLRGWLQANNATVMAVLILVIGVTQVGKGLGGLL